MAFYDRWEFIELSNSSYSFRGISQLISIASKCFDICENFCRLDGEPLTMYLPVMNFAKLPLLVKFAAVACLVLAIWIAYDLSHWWSTIEDYSFGYLAPIFCGYVLYDRWPKIAGFFDTSKPHDVSAQRSRVSTWASRIGTAALVCFSLGFVFGLVYRAFTGVSVPGSFIMTFSFAGVVLSSALVFSERLGDGSFPSASNRWRFACLFLFPALVWIISAPLMSVYESMIREFLLNKVTSVVYSVFNSLGFIIERHGNVLVLPKGSVGVEEACSGIRSLTGCLFAGAFLAAVFLDRFWKKIALVACAMVLAFCTNILRGIVLTGIAYSYGSKTIEGKVHDITGYAVLGLTVVLLLCLIPVFNFKLPTLLPPDGKKPDGAGLSGPSAGKDAQGPGGSGNDKGGKA
jgi:exosortase/archaeosortase family protein